MGASVAVVDFDRDGWQDFYVTNSAPGSLNRLYRNEHDGTFVDVAESRGLADVNRDGTGACMGSVWADFDNDGYEDVLVYKWGAVELFRNQQGESFERVTESAGLPAWANVGCATWLDYDRDGWIDLFLAGYWPDDVRLEKLEHTRIMPESFEYAKTAGASGCSETRATDNSRTSRRQSASTARAGRWPSWPRTSMTTRIPICSWRTTTACRSCS